MVSSRVFRRGSKWVTRSVRWPLCLIFLGSIGFLVAAAITWCCPYVPIEHDEFSYLLGADTLRHGRLSNPAPMVWEAFQTFHVIMQPSYASKYPMGPAILIAVGWSMFGQPIAGSWIAAGICCASVAWMLAGAFRKQWAILGGLLVALHPMFQTVWSQTLHGGWLAAAGCSLLFGALLRLRRRESLRHALLGGIGIAILAITRPFEGFVCVAVSIMAFGIHQIRTSSGWYWKSIGVATIPVTMAAILIAAQNLATTGSILTMPYQVHEQAYGVAPLFVFGQPNQPMMEATQPSVFYEFHRGWSMDCYRERVGWSGLIQGLRVEYGLLTYYWGLGLTIFPLTTFLLWNKFRWAKLTLLLILSQLAAASLVTWIFPRYLAPITPWLTFLTILSCRVLNRSFGAQRKYGLICASALLLFEGYGYILSIEAWKQHPGRHWASSRNFIEQELCRRPGKHLILVEYGVGHNVHQEWVYNLADLQSQKVIWARAEREDWERRLLQCYGEHRSVWKLNPDNIPSTSRREEILALLRPAKGGQRTDAQGTVVDVQPSFMSTIPVQVRMIREPELAVETNL